MGGAAALLAATVVNLALAYFFARSELTPVPFGRQVAPPLLAAAGAAGCFKALAGAGAWAGGGAAILFYLALFSVWGRRDLTPTGGRAVLDAGRGQAL
jgi:hypothetical protein